MTRMPLRPRTFVLAMLIMLLAYAPLTRAERADRDKPVNLEADRVTLDDRNKVHVFEGRVTLTQGTLVIHADKIVVTQDPAGFQTGVAYGNPARFRQKREGRDEMVEGEAERVEHDTRTERTQFFNRAIIRSGGDEVRGQYIRYDAQSENYLVTSGPDGTVVPPSVGRDSRVRVVIQPRRKEPAAPASANPPASLKPTPQLSNPRSE